MKNKQSGQALLLILLSVGVIITIGLSVVSKSVTDISTTQTSEESLRAFSAAEAGVEETLKKQVSVLPTNAPVATDQSIGNSTYSTVSSGFPSDTSMYAYPVELVSGDIGHIWFSSHRTNNTLTCSGSPCYTGNQIDLCWGKTGVSLSNQPAIAVAVVYEDTVPAPIRYVVATFDPVSSRRAQDHFGSGTPPGNSPGITTDTNNGACSVGSTKFANRVRLNFNGLGISNAISNGGLMKGMIVRVFYNTAPTIIGVNSIGGARLPLQGRIIESTGESGDSTRKVQVYAIYPEIPNIFQSAIYSPPGITKTP